MSCGVWITLVVKFLPKSVPTNTLGDNSLEGKREFGVCAMVGETVKRSSEDCSFVNTKKKKISKDKHDVNGPKEKTTTVCNGESRQKKAFFAYFGKAFDNESSAKTNNDDSDVKKSVNKITNANDQCMKTSVFTNNREISPFSNKQNAPCFIKYFLHLHYFSRIIY